MDIGLTIGVAYAILTLSAIVWIIVEHVKHKNAKRVDDDDDDLFGKTLALWVRILISLLLPLLVLALPLFAVALPFIVISALKKSIIEIDQSPYLQGTEDCIRFIKCEMLLRIGL